MPRINPNYNKNNLLHKEEKFHNRQALKTAAFLKKVAEKKLVGREQEILPLDPFFNQQANPIFARQQPVDDNTPASPQIAPSVTRSLAIIGLVVMVIGATNAITSVPREMVPQHPSQNNNARSKSSNIAHPQFLKAQNKPGFGDGPHNPFSPVDMSMRKVCGQMGTVKLAEVKKMTSTGGFTSGNAILVTKDATETTQLRMKMIQEAKQSIEISGNFGGGQVFLETIKELQKAMEANPELKVHLLFSDDLINAPEMQALKELAVRFPNRAHYQITGRHLDPLSTSVENHVKLTVIDGKYMIVGGTGIADHLVTPGDKEPPVRERTLLENILSRGARDQDSIIVGPMALTARSEYFKLLRKWEGVETKSKADLRWFPLNTKANAAVISEIDHSPRLDKGAKVKLYTCGPEAKNNPCTQAVVDLIIQGDKVVTLAHMNQNYVREVSAALDERLARGGEVRIITNSYSFSGLVSGDTPPSNLIMCAPSKSLEHPKVERYHYAISGVLYHKKITLSKGKEETCFAIGSYNLAKKSHSGDDEIMMVACHSKATEAASPALKQIAESIEEDIRLSEKDLTTGKIMEEWSFFENGLAAFRGAGRAIKGAILVPEIIGSYLV